MRLFARTPLTDPDLRPRARRPDPELRPRTGSPPAEPPAEPPAGPPTGPPTRLPIKPASEPPTVIAVIGSPSLAAVLGQHLPAGHRIECAERLDDAPHADALILHRANPRTVAAAVRRQPGTPVIALIDTYAPVDTLIGVLEAGADTCVRSGETVLLAGHLMACLRRYRLARSQPTPSSRPATSQPAPEALPA